MDLLPTPEQEQIADAIRTVLADRFPTERLRKRSTTLDPGEWSQLAGLGWLGLGLPEAAGGSGLSTAEETLLARELGRVLMAPSLLATIAAAHLARESGWPALARSFVEGGARAAFAVPLPPRDRERGSHFLVDDGHATHALVVSETAALLVEPRNRHPVPSFDESLAMSVAQVDAADAVARAEGAGIARRLVVLIAAHLSGVAEGARDMAVAYATTRQQFGQPIGAFQAVKHACADMAVRCEAAWFQSVFAALSPASALHGAAALRMAQQAAIANAEANVQVHGAMGFSQECDAHRFVKRAQVLARLVPSARILEDHLLETSA